MRTVRLFEHDIAFVILDIDGTLTDLYARLWEYYAEITVAFNLPYANVIECRMRQESGAQEIPLTLRAGLIGVWQKLADDTPRLQSVVDYFHELEIKFPYPEVVGSRDLIERLSSRGIRFDICTTNSYSGAQRKLESLKVRLHRIAALHAGNDEPRKPDPGALLRLCHIVGVPPNQTLYVADTQGDARMALEAGVIFAGVKSGRVPIHEFLRCGVDERYIFDTAAHIPFKW